MKCPTCGFHLESDDLFCTQCGGTVPAVATLEAESSRIPAASVSCTTCGASLAAGDAFCSSCGATVPAAAAPAPRVVSTPPPPATSARAQVDPAPVTSTTPGGSASPAAPRAHIFLLTPLIGWSVVWALGWAVADAAFVLAEELFQVSGRGLLKLSISGLFAGAVGGASAGLAVLLLSRFSRYSFPPLLALAAIIVWAVFFWYARFPSETAIAMAAAIGLVVALAARLRDEGIAWIGVALTPVAWAVAGAAAWLLLPTGQDLAEVLFPVR